MVSTSLVAALAALKKLRARSTARTAGRDDADSMFAGYQSKAAQRATVLERFKVPLAYLERSDAQ
jgi:hypothetical protein